MSTQTRTIHYQSKVWIIDKLILLFGKVALREHYISISNKLCSFKLSTRILKESIKVLTSILSTTVSWAQEVTIFHNNHVFTDLKRYFFVFKCYNRVLGASTNPINGQPKDNFLGVSLSLQVCEKYVPLMFCSLCDIERGWYSYRPLICTFPPTPLCFSQVTTVYQF